MTTELPSFVASESIPVSVFVNVLSSSSVNRQVEVCDAGDLAIGISAEYPEDPVLPGASIGAHATAGNPVKVYGEGQECLVKAGGTFNSGAYLKPDGSGYAVSASSTNAYSAIALEESEASGELVKVLVTRGVTP